MSLWRNQLAGPTDPAEDAGWQDAPARKGFFTDTSICIGCKACEVACKEWNSLPMDGVDWKGSSYDNTWDLGSNTWRHVAFIEQPADRIVQARESGRVAQARESARVDLGMPTVGPPGSQQAVEPAVPEVRWLMASDVCKHCTHAGCLDVCPTGALFRTEFGTVVVQDDVCNGCGYCVPACPFGVIGKRESDDMTGSATGKEVGISNKCTLCYDRLHEDQMPACAQACPTTSIKFGDHDDMVAEAEERMKTLHAQGFTEARLYGTDENDGVGGTGSVFLLLDEPEVYGLPPDPVVSTSVLPDIARHAAYAAATMVAAAAFSFVGGRR